MKNIKLPNKLLEDNVIMCIRVCLYMSYSTTIYIINLQNNITQYFQ